MLPIGSWKIAVGVCAGPENPEKPCSFLGLGNPVKIPGNFLFMPCKISENYVI